MAEKTLQDLFYDGLKDIYYAERKILKALPKMARGAQADELKAAFEKHHEETQGHVERLQQVFEILGKRAAARPARRSTASSRKARRCSTNTRARRRSTPALVAAAQAVEHYEIARYGTLKRWAETLGMADAAKLLDATLQEEAATDEALTDLAQSGANERALAA